VPVKAMVQRAKRTAPPVSAEVIEPLPAPEMEARIDESPAPKQAKSFWSRLYVFKKKKSVEAEKQ
jgi:hypothetical protein